MSNLKDRYKEIITELENHFQDEKEREFVVKKFQELSIVFMDIIDRLTYITDIRVKEVEEKQNQLEGKLVQMEQVVDNIENDIYENDDESYEFEIACPYCNFKFVADINSDFNTEVECPECHNVIELDWNSDEDECEHECSHCAHDCMQHENETYNDGKKKKNQTLETKNDEEVIQEEQEDEDNEDEDM